MFILALSQTLLKLAVLLIVCGVLVLALELNVNFSSTEAGNFRSQDNFATLSCNSAGFCDLVLGK